MSEKKKPLRERLANRFGLQTVRQVEEIAKRAADEAAEEIRRSHPFLMQLIEDRDVVGTTDGLPPLDQDFGKYFDAIGLADVSAAVDAIGQTEAQVELCAFMPAKNPEDAPEKVKDHPLVRVLENPNPDEGSYAFRKRINDGLGYAGEAILVGVSRRQPKVPFGDHIRGIRPADDLQVYVQSADTMFPVMDKSRSQRGRNASPIVAWDCDNGRGTTKRIPAEEVIAIVDPHPRDPVRGLSPIRKFEPELNLAYHAMSWAKDYFENGATISTLITGEEELGPEAVAMFKAQFSQRHVGQGNRFRPLYLGGSGLSVSNLSNNPKDALLMELLNHVRQRILSVYKVPPFAIALLEHANWSNSESQQRMLLTHAVKPRGTLITTTLNSSRWLMAYGDGVYLEHNWAAEPALQDDASEKAKETDTLVKARVMSIEEARERHDLGEVDPEHTFASAAPAAPSPVAGGEDAEDPMPEEAERSIVGAVARHRRGELIRLARKDRAAKESSWKAKIWRAAEESRTRFDVSLVRQWRRLLDDLGDDVMQDLDRATRTLTVVNGSSGFIRRADSDLATELSGEWKSGAPLWSPKRIRDLAVSWTARLDSLWKRVAQAGAEDASEMNTGEVSPFDLDDPRVSRFIENELGTRVTTVAENRLQEVTQIVKRAAEDGVTVGELKIRLREHFEGRTAYWAERIARTETAGLYNTGQMAAFEDAGIGFKTWLSSRDSRVRDSHLAMERRTEATPIPLSEPFVFGEDEGGGSGMYPGSIDSAANNVNCRCLPAAAEV